VTLDGGGVHRVRRRHHGGSRTGDDSTGESGAATAARGRRAAADGGSKCLWRRITGGALGGTSADELEIRTGKTADEDGDERQSRCDL
jgi:hypothetical protein